MIKINRYIVLVFITVIISSCITHKCYRGIYATEKLIELDKSWLGKIISNDTIYSNSNIVLTNSELVCTEEFTRTMKIIHFKRDSTLFLVPFESEFRNDSLLYVNYRFFISPLDKGLIVANSKKGNSTNYEYPDDENLERKTNNIKKAGLYRYDDGKFKFITESVSKESFEKYCTNDTCYIPYPGLLYDRKINLNHIKFPKMLD